MGTARRKITLIEGNAKRRHLCKKMTGKRKGILRQEAQIPILLHHKTLHAYTCTVYSIHIYTGKGERGGRVEPEKRGEGQQFTYQHDRLYSIQTLIKACRKVHLQVNFLVDDILLWYLYLCSKLVHGTAL